MLQRIFKKERPYPLFRALCAVAVLLLGIPGAARAVRPREIVEQGFFGRGLQEPASLWFDRYRNRILVADTGNHRVMVYSTDGKELLRLGRRGELAFPFGVASDRAGNLYISEQKSGRVKVLRHYDEIQQSLDKKEEYINLPLEETGGKKPAKAGRIFVGKDDRIYMIDTANQRVLVLNPDGAFLLAFGAHGIGRGKFLRPADLCLDSAGRIYVTDPGAERVQVFTSRGKFLYRLGRDIRRVQGIDLAVGIAVDRMNNVWMTDRARRNLFVEDQNGNRVFQYPEGNGPGIFSFPVGLAFGTTDRLYVLEKGSGTIRVFGIRY